MNDEDTNHLYEVRTERTHTQHIRAGSAAHAVWLLRSGADSLTDNYEETTNAHRRTDR